VKGSLHIAKVAGIPVKVHWTFGLLLLWVIWQSSTDGFQPLLMLAMTAFVLSIFFCVVLHEFGHALAARSFGVKTFDIVMTPIGGIARLERMPEGRGEEFWVAIAGPAVNFAIIALIWIGFYIIKGEALPLFEPAFWNLDRPQSSYFILLLLANGWLGMFNLLPAFPMDGGRMLRSLLSLRMDRTRATQIASYAGQAIALGMFALGIYRAHPTLTLIGVFIFFAARQEYKALVQQQRLLHTRARDIMAPIEHLIFTGNSVADARHAIHGHPDKAFVVWARPGVPAGFITRDTRSQSGIPEEQPIEQVMSYTPVVIAPDLPLQHVFSLMQQHQLPLVLLYDQTGYLGVVNRESINL